MCDGTREKRRAQLKKLVRVRVGTLNVGTMTGRGRELTDLMETGGRWKCCVCRRLDGRGQGERVGRRLPVAT